MTGGEFFRLTIGPGDEPDVRVITYSCKWTDVGAMALIAKNIREFAASLEFAHPHPLVWREPWVDQVVFEEWPKEFLVTGVETDGADLDIASEWRRKRGLDL